ncbi:hypothetical protein [Salibacterium lacus]|uniref:Uncharacterized protein n=1 Tax=Salibacterium lacus TaxID=1898109 RepID=A0ABW5T149_9BACI
MTQSPRSGRVKQSDGTTQNIVDILGGGTPLDKAPVNINKFAAQGDEVVGEDGNVYSFTQLLQNVGGGGTVDSVDWADVQNKPSSYNPTNHNHDELYYTKQQVDDEFSALNPYQVKNNSGDSSPGYLENKIDGSTLATENNVVVVKDVQGLTIGIVEINDALTGTETNIQSQINQLKNDLESAAQGMHFYSEFETKADLDGATTMTDGAVAIVLADETHDGNRTMYIYSGALGMWRYVGRFEYVSNFLEMQDTPTTYENADGKIVKVDETNGRLLFDFQKWSDIQDGPSSSPTDIDEAASQRHEHTNKPSLDQITVENGSLFINGVEFVPKKQTLYARRTGSNQSLPNGETLVFNSKTSGDIDYDESTGEFTLEQGKTYSITAQFHMYFGDNWTMVKLVYADTEEEPSEGGAQVTLNAVNAGNANNTGNILSALITPSSTRAFKLMKSDTQGNSNDTLKGDRNSSSLRIVEV